ncbi:MAG: phospholipid carrier-dependent glycosyltransferase [Victivallaceae bacterium]|nr:phospholipid carrier-dependent glycosyltransferase [Victivallaceae bacterium]
MNKKAFIILAGIFTLLYLGTLAFRPLYAPDEPRYAEIARELLIHNDWVVPKLDNLAYFEKPIMGHWLNALSLKVFGENSFAVRFSSGLLALFTALMLGGLVRRFTGRRPAFMTATIYLTMGLVFGVGTYAVLDTPFNFFLTGTLAAFFCAAERKKWGWSKTGWLILTGLFCGGAFLTKGFLAFAIPGSTILAFLIWERRWKSIFSLPWIPLAVMLAVIAPWTILVHLRAPDFWHYFFWVEHIERFTGNEASQHPEGWWFLLPWVIIGPLPWTFLLPQIIKGYGRRRREYFRQPLLRYAACWVIFPLLLCSASSGKLITYILPVFPGIAILLAFGLNEYLKAGKFKDLNLTFNILSWALFAAVTGVAVTQLLVTAGIIRRGLYDAEETYKWSIAALALVLLAAALRAAVKAVEGEVKFGYLAFGTILVMFTFPLSIPNLIEIPKAPAARLEKFKNRVGPGTVLVSYKNLISAVCWTFKRDDVYLYHKAGELTYGLSRNHAASRLLSNEDFLKLVKNPATEVAIIMNSDKHRKTLPDFRSGVWENGIFFKEYRRK